jgi:hypothetical protein
MKSARRRIQLTGSTTGSKNAGQMPGDIIASNWPTVKITTASDTARRIVVLRNIWPLCHLARAIQPATYW